MITENFLQEILIKPLELNADELRIVSGYASAAMVFRHFEEASNAFPNLNDLKIHLVIGMTSRDGVSEPDHKNYIKFMESDFKDRFTCSYIYDDKPIHSKVYAWLRNGRPIKAFMGSCNYSQAAFINCSQKEIAYECNADEAYQYHLSQLPNTIFCNHQDAESLLDLYKYNVRAITQPREHHESNHTSNQIIDGLEKVTVSLVDRTGIVPERSQLNWGQRDGREPNQAYFQLSPDVWRSEFFPKRGIHFSVLTDDNKTLVCTRAQKNEYGCAIETPHNNSLLGEYIRYRLGLSNGQKVILDDLTRYGRTSIDFYKVDDENYFMDFSKP